MSERLGRILLLRRLGFSLDDIVALFESPDPIDLSRVVGLHRSRLEAQARQIDTVLATLDGIQATIDTGRPVHADTLFRLLELMMDFEKHYTSEQLEQLKQRRDALGEAGMQKAQQDWQDLIREVREAQAAGTAPDSAEGRDLAGRWQALIEAFTGGDPGIHESLSNVYRSTPGAMAQAGIDPSMMEWIGKAGQSGS